MINKAKSTVYSLHFMKEPCGARAAKFLRVFVSVTVGVMGITGNICTLKGN